MKDMIQRYTSRKFLISAAAVTLMVLGEFLGFSAAQYAAISTVVITYIGVEGKTDWNRALEHGRSINKSIESIEEAFGVDVHKTAAENLNLKKKISKLAQELNLARLP